MGTLDHLSQEVRGLQEAAKDIYKQLHELQETLRILTERMDKIEKSFEYHIEIHPSPGYDDNR